MFLRHVTVLFVISYAICAAILKLLLNNYVNS